jgi:hypothetical protein
MERKTMKSKLIILLTFASIVFVLAGNYFQKKQNEIETILSKASSLQKEGIALAKMNKWIKNEPNILLEQLENRQTAEEKLLNLESNIKKLFNTTVSSIDKSKHGVLSLSITSKIQRDDIDSLLRLYKLTVINGYVDFKSVTVANNYVITNFDLIKFYKG